MSSAGRRTERCERDVRLTLHSTRKYAPSKFTLQVMASELVTNTIYDMHRKGYSYRRIAAYLDRKRVPPARADRWSAMTVRNIAVREAARRHEQSP